MNTFNNGDETNIVDFFDHEPTKNEKIEMRNTSKTPSEWLKLLCTEWSNENKDLITRIDSTFIQYKSYLKGQLSSQLLCRLTIPERLCINLGTGTSRTQENDDNHVLEFWKKMGVEDCFDRTYITSQIERFCSLYSILSLNIIDDDVTIVGVHTTDTLREQRRIDKINTRQQRQKFQKEKKEAALQRAADVVNSDKTIDDFLKGTESLQATNNHSQTEDKMTKKPRSSVVVSTASDLHRIVTHAKDLFAKYHAIAKEHNQKVNWLIVSKELGIHVKVREKYARMHTRATERGFDFDKCGDYKIRDHPDIFLDPISSTPSTSAQLHHHDSIDAIDDISNSHSQHDCDDENDSMNISAIVNGDYSVTAISDDAVVTAVTPADLPRPVSL